ncbi:MAG TPA: serine protease [Sphingopyxis sp.]|nr:serine protease [Sphingopyxis sp.]
MADQIGILKSIWTQDKTGKWSIHDLQGLNLKPREGCTNKYFKLKDELSLLTNRPGSIMDNLFASFGSTEFLVRQSIVPVVAWNEGDTEVRCIGTGFFISATGLLMTAAHVVRDPVDEDYAGATKIDNQSSKLSDNLHFGIMLPANPAMRDAPFYVPAEVRQAKCFICPFEWTQHWGKEIESPLLGRKPEFKLELDIAICKVRQFPLIGPYQPLNIGLHNLKIGDRAVAIGYAEMKNMKLGAYEQPELVVSVGEVTMIYPDNIKEKQNSTPGPNFEFSAKIPGKMSGSPILVGSGILTKGVVSRSWEGEELASGCLIAATMHLPLHGEKSLLNLQQAESEGMAKMSGPDL